ncbi:MAG: magnesium/cobalt efflux protein, partial [Gammaproteobacteria bacterium]|nr:magnesium/cobalt efflux protein [Gammaproteobacteria bacterium]
MSEAEERRRGWRERITDLFSGEPADQGELKEMLQDAADREIMDGEALNIIYGALQVSEMHARDIMIPRSQVVCVDADARPETFL